MNKYFKDTSSAANIFMKQFNNGSIIFLSYGQTESDFDRIRGAACDMVAYDEVQDCQLEGLPVLYETLAASEHAYKRHYGTAKSELNTLEILFKRGSGCEWCIQCDHCKKWNIPDNIDTCLAMCSQQFGPCCAFCKKPIDVEKGKWVAARPTEKDHLSFHIPRHVLSARIDAKKWKDLQLAIKNYTPTKLANEVFGLASGVAGRTLSQSEAMSCCNPEKREFDKGWPRDGRGILSVVLGVDWSVTGGEASYTVVSVLGYDYRGKPHLLYAEKMQGIDILQQVSRIVHLYRQFECQMMASDRGVGQVQIELLRSTFGADRVISTQYCAAKSMYRYDKQGGFLAADRTQAMDNVFIKAKLGRDMLETPCWDLMMPFWSDALAIYEEESLAGRRLYRKDEGSTDDWLHSMVFAHTAWMCLSGQYAYVDQLSAEDLTAHRDDISGDWGTDGSWS